MRNANSHVRALSRRPARAQTVQQLKFDTLIIYMENAYLLMQGGLIAAANTNNVFSDLGDSIPYKGFFGGSGTTDTTT